MKLRNKLKVFVFTFIFTLFTQYTFADVKTEVYSKLKCCNCKKEFTPCVCAHAKEMKDFIDALLINGLNKDEVLLKVAQKYSLDVIINKEMRDKIEKKLIETRDPNSPEIFIQPLSYDLGKISKTSGELKLAVDVQNKGKSTLTINDLKTSCSCVTVKIEKKDSVSPAFGVKGTASGWKVDLAPGEKAKLIIVTDLNHPAVRLGHMLRTVEIKSDDPVHSLIKVEFEVEIVK